MKAKQASKKKRVTKPPVVKAFSPAPDIVSVHIRAEPDTEDPKTLFQKLADWFNDK